MGEMTVRFTSRGLFVPLASAVAGLGLLLSGCANKPITPQPGEYAFVVGGGSSSNQNVHYIVDPGVHIKVSNGDRAIYVPAGVRDFITGKPGTAGIDRSDPNPVYTKAGDNGVKPIQVTPYSHVVFMLNPNHAILKHFYNEQCVKYGCGALNPADSSSNTLILSSPPGWLNMIRDKFSTAVDNATRDASALYGPDLWHDTARWNAFGNEIAKFLPKELRLATGAGTLNYFCGPGSTASKCAPFTVLVNDIVPVDNAISQQYSQQNESDLQSTIAQNRQDVAKKLYGDEWGYWNGVFQALQICKQTGQQCNIYIASPSQVPTSK
jgi:hypothetical protein